MDKTKFEKVKIKRDGYGAAYYFQPDDETQCLVTREFFETTKRRDDLELKKYPGANPYYKATEQLFPVRYFTKGDVDGYVKFLRGKVYSFLIRFPDNSVIAGDELTQYFPKLGRGTIDDPYATKIPGGNFSEVEEQLAEELKHYGLESAFSISDTERKLIKFNVAWERKHNRPIGFLLENLSDFSEEDAKKYFSKHLGKLGTKSELEVEYGRGVDYITKPRKTEQRALKEIGSAAERLDEAFQQWNTQLEVAFKKWKNEIRYAVETAEAAHPNLGETEQTQAARTAFYEKINTIGAQWQQTLTKIRESGKEPSREILPKETPATLRTQAFGTQAAQNAAEAAMEQDTQLRTEKQQK
jgi:hypothetical protein